MDDLPKNQQLLELAKRDQELRDAGGQEVVGLPHGAMIRDVSVYPDERGFLFEVFDEAWGWHPDPLTRTYVSTILPGVAKGWNLHKEHEDRYTVLFGEMSIAMYDGREDSPTFGGCFQVLLSERRRRSLTMPIGVWHCDYNLGDKEVVFINCPTGRYEHQSPDKYRLPLYCEEIPFKIPPGLTGY
jgi:dTDP-4-dehydrorhamnose 3,5-epimerase